MALELSRVDGRPVTFRPGQWVSVAVPVANNELWRAYSIASVESPTAGVELLVSRIPIGLVSEALHILPVGAQLRVSDPAGTFRLAEGPGDAAFPTVFAATGTGIAPFRSMIRAALAQSGGPITLLHGVRAEEDLLFRDEWQALARTSSRFRYVPTLSRPGADWAGARGHVGPLVEAAVAEAGVVPGTIQSTGFTGGSAAASQAAASTDVARPHVYLCGLRRMTDSVAHRLRERGVARERIHVERFD